jgi:DNA-binding MarR family transcriptional regulator
VAPPRLQIQPNGDSLPHAGGDDLRRLIQAFIRSLGLLSFDQTPCGQPLSVSHAHALMVLLEATRAGERLSQRELAQALGIDKSNVTRLCRRMESAGHLVQRRSADDGRVRLLSLTPAGNRLATNVERSSRDRFERLMSAIPPSQRADVLSSLACLNRALTTADAPIGPLHARKQPAQTSGDRA